MRPTSHRSPGFSASLALLALGASLAGCGTVCPDNRPSCDVRYPASRVAVHAGGAWSGARSVWTDATGQLRGSLDEGVHWSVAGLDGSIVIGEPALGQVVLAPDPTSTVFVTDVASGTWTDPAVGYGTTVAAAAPDSASPEDLWVSAPSADTYGGEVLRYANAASDPGGAPAIIVTAPSAGDRLGEGVVPCPDLTGDGETDWLVSLPGFSGLPDGTATGAASLGGAVAVLSSDRFLADSGSVDVRDVGTLLWGSLVGEGFGTAMTCAGDLTGDGVPDVVVGAPWADARAGRVYVFSGADLKAGSAETVSWWEIASPDTEGWFGASVAIGDFNGDGVDDLAIGAPGAHSGLGEVLVYDGTAVRARASDLAPRTTIDVQGTLAMHIGTTLAAGHLAPDALDDLLVGVPHWRTTQLFDEGRVLVFDGAADWASTLVAGQDETRSVDGDQAFQRVGRNMALADLDGDGNLDLLLPTRDRAPP